MHIVFKVFSAHSHLNATFKLAQALKAGGYLITYAGIRDFESHVANQGLNYYVDDDVLPSVVPSTKKPSIIKRLQFKDQFKKYHIDYLKGTGFDAIIKNLKPDLIVVDSPYVRHAIPLYSKGIPFIIFESMVALNKVTLHPPLCSNIVVNNNFTNKFLVEVAWAKFFLISYIKRVLFGELFPPSNYIKKLAESTNFPLSAIDFNRYFHIGLNNIPEIIASPKEFDFPYKKMNNQHYMGTSVILDRKEASYDFKFDLLRTKIDCILSQNKINGAHQKVALIYCSFGSMSWRYEGLNAFYQKLILAFKNDPRFLVLISIGYDVSYHNFKDLPENIHVFRKVPQMEILKKVDLMITHGGMNTITECILSEVPMLVYPGTKEIDQVGNACRVKYHKIGLMGSLLKDSSNLIRQKVSELLSNESFKTAVCEIKNKMLLNDDIHQVIELIDSILKGDGKAKPIKEL